MKTPAIAVGRFSGGSLPTHGTGKDIGSLGPGVSTLGRDGGSSSAAAVGSASTAEADSRSKLLPGVGGQLAGAESSARGSVASPASSSTN